MVTDVLASLLKDRPCDSNASYPVFHSHLAWLYEALSKGMDKNRCYSHVEKSNGAVRAMDGCVYLHLILTICLILKRKKYAYLLSC